MKFWTPAEANRALPLVKRIVRDLVDKVQEIESLKEIVESRKRRNQPDEVRGVIADIESRLPAVEALETELSELGVQLKDYRTGLIDFPAKLDGKTVLLCWKLGESRIDFWHDLVSGFPGRTPLKGHFEE